MAMILKTVAPRQGALWVRDAMRLYARRPLAFTGMFFLFTLFAQLLVLIPGLRVVALPAAVPLLSLGMMVASRSALADGPVRPSQYVEPFRGNRERARSLAVLCAIFAAATIGLLTLVDVATGDGLTRMWQWYAQTTQRAATDGDVLAADRSVAAAALAATIVVTLLAALFWHAPALVHWGGQGALQAVFSSALAVWRARGAFVVYSLAWTALTCALVAASAIVIALLGSASLAPLVIAPAWFFLSTLFYVSLIFTFEDSFGRP